MPAARNAAATGLIAGESLFGVAFAGIAAASGSPTPLLVDSKTGWTVVTFIGVVVWLYLRIRRAVQTTA